MEEEGIDPSSVNKNPQLIKAAQEEIAVMDVLVCGKCHLVFHFMEEFQEHKGKNECGTPVFKGNLSEPKPQVWAFLLWKSSQSKFEGDGADQVSSWKLYQKWCKMPDSIREAWIAAGKAIQVSTTLASAKMQEVKAPLQKVAVRQQGGVVKKVMRGRPPLQTVSSLQKLAEPEKTEDNSNKEESKKEDKPGGPQENGGESEVNMEIKEEQVSEAEVEAAFEDEDEEEEERRQRLEAGESIEEIDKSIQRMRQPGPAAVLKKKTDGEAKAISATKRDSGSEDEYVVERIVSRRYNIRKKAYEYLLKWEGYPDDQNTWEPAENLADCKHLLENFERNLAKQKELQQSQGKVVQRGPSGLPSGPKVITAEIPSTSQPSSIDSSPSKGRPVRSSKKKAMDQVKAWCGSMSTRKIDDEALRDVSDLSDDEDGISRKLKRSSESEDMSQYDGLSSDELPIKRKKKEEEEFVVRRGPGRPRKILKVNGDSLGSISVKEDSSSQDLAKSILGEFITSLDGSTGKGPIVLGKKPDGSSALSPNQQPVLVANSKGVVKVDPRSMPNISSGVYIMSSKANSGGSGLIKVEQVATPNVKVVTGPGQKQGGILAMKDAKSAGNETVEVLVSSSGSPVKATILGGKKLQSVIAAPPLTPIKLMPKLVSPQMKGGLVKVAPRPHAPIGAGVSPRPLIAADVRPGLVRTPVPTRPTLLSPRVASSPASGAGRGVHPIRPKQALTVSGGRVVSSPLVPGMKSGIRPIEALLGGGRQSITTATSSAPKTDKTDSSTTPEVIKKDSSSVLLPVGSGSAKAKPEPPRTALAARGRGRGRGGRVVDIKTTEDKTKPAPDNFPLDFPEDQDDDSDSDSDCGLPDDFPTGDLPPIEPASPERPLTLCPLTGKILARAEGEKTPPPTPPPESMPSAQPTAASSTTTVLLEDGGLDGEGETLIKVEMSPGGTTGTVVGDETTTLLRTSGGLTVKRMSAGGTPGKGSSLLSSVTTVANNSQIQGISLPARKLFAEENEEVVQPESELVTIQGPDGVMYQVHGQLQDGAQTLLVQGEDGEQRCVYVTTNQEGEDGSTVLTLDSAYADAVAQLDPGQVSVLGDGSQLLVHNEDGTTTLGDTQLMSVIEAGDKEDPQAQIVAQVVQAGEAPPGGGPRNVVLLLPDGNLMVTEVDEEQYAALELDK